MTGYESKKAAARDKLLDDDDTQTYQNHPAQEPVAWMNPSWIDPDTRGWQSDSFESIPIEGWLPIYTTPPQRPWVGLTEHEFQLIYDMGRTPSGMMEMVESMLKDKNT